MIEFHIKSHDMEFMWPAEGILSPGWPDHNSRLQIIFHNIILVQISLAGLSIVKELW